MAKDVTLIDKDNEKIYPRTYAKNVYMEDGNTTVDDKKADKVSGATANNLASLDADGNLQDSGININDVNYLSMLPSDNMISGSGTLVAGEILFTASNNGVFYMRYHFTSDGWVGIHLRSENGADLAYNTQRMLSNSGYGSNYNATFVMRKGQQIYCYENGANTDWGGWQFINSEVI